MTMVLLQYYTFPSKVLNVPTITDKGMYVQYAFNTRQLCSYI
jgi:hypothetical protein